MGGHDISDQAVMPDQALPRGMSPQMLPQYPQPICEAERVSDRTHRSPGSVRDPEVQALAMDYFLADRVR